MSLTQKKLKIPTQDDILQILTYINWIIPFPIVALTIVNLSKGCKTGLLTTFLYFLITLHHGCKLYLDMSSAVFSHDPI